jgi:hypothetical protein
MTGLFGQPIRELSPIEQAELIYAAYPRKASKGAALTAILKAMDRLSERKDDAYLWLKGRVEAYAKSPAGSRKGKDKQFIPHCATWMNRERYDDPDSEWQIGGEPEIAL